MRPDDQESTIWGAGCPCSDDRGDNGGIWRYGALVRRDSRPRQISRLLGAEAGRCRAAAVWSGRRAPQRLCAVFAAHRARGVHCYVVALTLVPVMAGYQVKIARRDAEKLARRTPQKLCILKDSRFSFCAAPCLDSVRGTLLWPWRLCALCAQSPPNATANWGGIYSLRR